MARSWDEDMRGVLQTYGGNLNIFNTQLQTADIGWSIDYVRTGVKTNPCKIQQVELMFKEPLTILFTHSMVQRP